MTLFYVPAPIRQINGSLTCQNSPPPPKRVMPARLDKWDKGGQVFIIIRSMTLSSYQLNNIQKAIVVLPVIALLLRMRTA